MKQRVLNGLWCWLLREYLKFHSQHESLPRATKDTLRTHGSDLMQILLGERWITRLYGDQFALSVLSREFNSKWAGACSFVIIIDTMCASEHNAARDNVRLSWQNARRSRLGAFAMWNSSSQKRGNKANKNAFEPAFVHSSRYFFSTELCLALCHTQNERYSEINSSEQSHFPKAEKEMDTQRTKQVNWTPWIQLFMNCLPAENNGGIVWKGKKRE